MRRIIALALIAVLMMVVMAASAPSAFASGNGWGPCQGETNKTAVGSPTPDNNCGHHEGVSQGGHDPGTPNGFCSETYEYAYNCNKTK